MIEHKGGCHCGKVRFSVEADFKQGIACNCSLCGKRGGVLGFVPAGQFSLQKGEEALIEYRFNTKKIQHLFCATCGTASFSRGSMPDGSPMVAVNLRCLDDFELKGVAIREFDGKRL